MNSFFLRTLAIIGILFCGLVQSKEIALSFDDAPRKDTHFTGAERARRLIKSLKDSKAKQVVFFCTTNGTSTKEGKERLISYARAGHLLANHTHTHKHPDKIGVDSYMADLKKAGKILRDFDNFVNWFRYPFLDYGKTVETRDELRKQIKELGYTNGYVTVDNSDWYMDYYVQEAIRNGKSINWENLRSAYVDALWDSIYFYDRLAKAVIKRSPKHVLLLHENDLAALFVGDLVKRIRDEGWKIISPTEAYSDSISTVEPGTLINNNGRVAAIAHAEKYPGPKLDKYQPTKNVDAFFEERGVIQRD